MQFPSKTGRIGLTLFLAAAVVVAARAVEPDKFVPADSEAVVVINVSEIVNSPLFKKYALAQARAQLASSEDAKKFFAATGLDPLKDIHKVVIGVWGANGGEPKFLATVHGNFDPAKIEAAATAEAKAKGEELKVTEKNGHKIFEFKGKAAGDKPAYATFADNNTILFSQSEELTETGLKGGGKIAAGLSTALGKIGGKESVYLAAVITEKMKQSMSGNPQFKDIAPKLEYVTGYVDVTNDVKVKLTVQTSDAKAADKVKMTLAQFTQILGFMVAGQAENLGQGGTEAATNLLKKIEVKKDDNNAVSVTLEASEQVLKDIEEGAKGGKGGKGKKESKE